MCLHISPLTSQESTLIHGTLKSPSGKEVILIPKHIFDDCRMRDIRCCRALSIHTIDEIILKAETAKVKFSPLLCFYTFRLFCESLLY